MFRHATMSVSSIHFLTPSVIHGLLLLLDLTNTVAYRVTLRDVARPFLTLLSVNAKQSPYSLAYFACTMSLFLCK